MAIYHFSGQIISRTSKDGSIRSAVACASYRSGEKLFDERDQETKYYKRNVVPVAKILAPTNSPNWVYNREVLWNEVEKIEKRYDAQLAREFNVALPIELTTEKQEELTYKFCQKAFVDKGMVADICIHNDNKENPHFHVMLTIRPFKENREWGAKSKEEYSFDKYGNRIREKNGKYKSIKVSTTDWNKKETMVEWRKEWAAMTNEVLKDNGINERITCESYKGLESQELPTIHDGYVARDMERNGKESERINQNKLIVKFNNNLIDLRKYKEKKQENEDYKNFYRNFSPDEKRILKNSAKELKMYINYENVTNRLDQLNRWEQSLSFKDESIDKTNKLNRIDKEEEILNVATKVLETEANRFLRKNYNELNVDKFTIDEKIEIVNNTLENKKVLNTDEIQLVKAKVVEDNLKKTLKDIFNNNTRFTMSVQSDIEHIQKVFNELVKKYDINFAKPETVKDVPEQTLNNIESMINRKGDLIKSLEIMNSIYDSKLDKMYPTWQGRLNLTIEEKELFIMSKEYFGKTLMPDDFKNIPYKYNSIQQEEILNILDIKNDRLLKEKYPDFKINEAYKNMFYLECYSNKNLTKATEDLVKNYFNKDNFMKNYKVFDNINQHERGYVNSKGEKSLLFELIGNLINEIDNRVQEDKFEKDRLKKKAQKQKRQRENYSL